MKLIRRAWAWLRAGYWLVAAPPVARTPETTREASTLYVSGAPVAGDNVRITRRAEHWERRPN